MPITPDAIFGAGVGAVGQVLGLAGAKSQDRRQVNQQRKLNNLQIESQRIASKNQKDLDLQMWKDTNYSAQVEEAKKAGMSISALYGGSGASGATVGGGSQGVAGGSATDPSQAMGVQNAGMMQAAQLALMGAQKENIEADTANKQAGAEGTNVTTEGNKIEVEAKKKIGADAIAQRYQWNADKEGVESEKANAEWEAFKASGFQGKAFDDKNSLVGKAMQAGWNKAISEAQKAKTDNNIAKAEQVVKEFEAGLAKQGISPNSPWWVKVVGDLLEKIGLSPIGGAKTLNKIVRSEGGN